MGIMKSILDKSFLGSPELKRDVELHMVTSTKSGAVFLRFGSEISEVYASLFTERYIGYLKEYGIEAKEVTIQTDNGVEFSGRRRKRGSQGFTYVVEERLQAKHTFIPLWL